MTTETKRAGSFLLSEGNGHISRESIIILSGEGVLAAGTVLGIDTVSGKYAAYDGAASDGTETAVGILYAQVDATDSDADGVAVVRHAEVIEAELAGIDADGKADLAAVQIIAR